MPPDHYQRFVTGDGWTAGLTMTEEHIDHIDNIGGVSNSRQAPVSYRAPATIILQGSALIQDAQFGNWLFRGLQYGLVGGCGKRRRPRPRRELVGVRASAPRQLQAEWRCGRFRRRIHEGPRNISAAVSACFGAGRVGVVADGLHQFPQRARSRTYAIRVSRPMVAGGQMKI